MTSSPSEVVTVVAGRRARRHCATTSNDDLERRPRTTTSNDTHIYLFIHSFTMMTTTTTHDSAATTTTMTTTTTTSPTMTTSSTTPAFDSAVVYAPAKTTSGDANDDDGTTGMMVRAMKGARAVMATRGGGSAARGWARGGALVAGDAKTTTKTTTKDGEECEAKVRVFARGDWVIASHGAAPEAMVCALEEACARAEGAARRVDATKKALNAILAANAHGKGFAAIAFDGVSQRGFAVRHKTAPRVTYGHDADGALVLVMGEACAGDVEGDAERADLRSGRFIFGHGYVKPMEFEDFWATARSTRGASPAKTAYGVAESSPRARVAAKSYAATSTTTMTTSSPLKPSSPNAYVPPAVRARRAAEEAAEREAAAAAERVARRNSEALDAALAQTLHDNQRMASALGGALASALMKVASRASFASENAEVSRFHAARAKAPIAVANVQSASSFYSPAAAPAAPSVAAELVRQSFEASCARLSMDSRRGSIESSRMSLSRAAC